MISGSQLKANLLQIALAMLSRFQYDQSFKNFISNHTNSSTCLPHALMPKDFAKSITAGEFDAKIGSEN